MVVHDTLHNRQSQTGSAGATRTVATDKRLEQVFTLLRLNAGAIIFHTEPGAMRFRPATDFDPSVAITRSVHHHVGDRTLDRQRVHLHLNATRLKRRLNFALIATFCRHHFAQHGVEISISIGISCPVRR